MEELPVLESCKKRLKQKRKEQKSEIATMKSDYQELNMLKDELDQEPLSLEEEVMHGLVDRTIWMIGGSRVAEWLQSSRVSLKGRVLFPTWVQQCEDHF